MNTGFVSENDSFSEDINLEAEIASEKVHSLPARPQLFDE